MRDLFAKAPGAIVSISQLRNEVDKAIEKICKKDARISVDEDHQPGKDGVVWTETEVKEDTVVSVTTLSSDDDKKSAEKHRAVAASQKRQYPDTMKFFLSEEGKKASGWQRALALTKTGKGFAVLPFNMDAAYDPLLMRKIVKHAAFYFFAPEEFAEAGTLPIPKGGLNSAMESYKALIKEYKKNRRKWSGRVYEIWDAHVADASRLPQTYLEEAVYRWYFKGSGPGVRRENGMGMVKKMPEEAFEPLAFYVALNGGAVTSHDEIKEYSRPAEDLRGDCYKGARAPYLYIMEHFLASRYAKLADAVSDDIANTLSDEQTAFGAGLKSVLDEHYRKITAMGLLYVRMLVADQVMAHYSQSPKSVRRMRAAAERTLKG